MAKIFCCIVQKHLIVPTCPLSDGSCAWQHVQTRRCKYTVQQVDPYELAVLTGRSVPAPALVEELKEKLKSAIRPELTTFV